MSVQYRKLSSSQLDIWQDQKLYPKSPLYNIGGKLSIQGPIDVNVLRQAIGILIAPNFIQ